MPGYGNPLARLLRRPLEAERPPEPSGGPDGVARLLVRTDARRAPGREAGDRRPDDPEEAAGDSEAQARGERREAQPAGPRGGPTGPRRPRAQGPRKEEVEDGPDRGA